MAVEEIDTELFIDEIRNYPELWDSNRKEYTKADKTETWMKICTIFNRDFDKKSEEEKQIICKQYINRWKNIRDNYARTKKKHRLGKTTRPYIYARHLQFLRDRSPESGGRGDPEIRKKSIRLTISRTQTARKVLSKRRPTRNRRKEIKREIAEIAVAPPPPAQPEFEDDKAFFDSLIPMIKTFSIEQKLDLRSEVLNIVKKIRASIYQPQLWKNEHS